MASVYEHTLIFNKSSLEKFIALIKKNCVMRKDMYNLESDLVPKEDHKYNIGASDKRWKEIYGNNLYITGYEGGGGYVKTDHLIVNNPVKLKIGNSLVHQLYDGNEDSIHISIKELFSGDTSGGESADIVANDILKGEFTSQGQFKYSPYANKTEGASKSKNSKGFYFYIGTEDPGNGNNRLNLNGSFRAYKVYSAVFNDYAELRECTELRPGRCVVEDGKGHLHCSTERLMPGANIVSDTYGMLIGEGDAPIAVCGRVLAYPAEPRWSYSAGDAVCAGPQGTISKMSRDEIKEYPDRIVGYVSEIPDYEVWGSDSVQVDGRIWIKVN